MAKAFLRRTVLVSVALLSACTVHNSDVPGLSGPSEGSGPLQVPVQTPTARFTFAPDPPPANSPVGFDGSTSCVGTAAAIGPCGGNAGGALTSYSWNFGDGSTGSGPIVSHSYGIAATYNASLTVVNSSGRSHTTVHAVTVKDGNLPTARFTFSPAEPVPHYSVVFNAQISTPGSGHRITSWNWDFGDSYALPPGLPPQPTSGEVVIHQFFDPALRTYSVVLTVTDEAGQRVRSDPVSVTVNGTP